MKQLILPATGFELQVPNYFYFHDDGIVESIPDHTHTLNMIYEVTEDFKELEEQRLEKEAERDRNNPELTDVSYLSGKSVGYKYASGRDKNIPRGVHAHIYVLGGRPEPTLVKSRGHEEGEVVITLNRRDVIQQGLEKWGVGVIGFTSLPDEAKCDLAGICALMNRYGSIELSSFDYNLSTKDALIAYLRRNTNWRLE